MTARPSSHTPIYTLRDLANLVVKHDREHPDHPGTCACEDGLVSSLRIYFAPTISATSVDPRPYVPPDLLPSRIPDAVQLQLPGKLDVSTQKPWLQPKSGETKAEYDYRIAHSCYNCGAFIVDSVALNQHEDQCSLRGRRHDT